MKKFIVVMFVVSLCVGLFLVGCTNGQEGAQQGQPNGEIQENDQNAEAAVKNVVENFGKKLQKVSLLAPEDDVKQAMEENYGAYVAPTLLAQWAEEPQNAPGRLTSSPWPDRIEILSIVKVSDTSYLAEGEIIEVTNVEKESGEAAARRTITLTIERIEEEWFITEVELGEYKDLAANDVSDGAATGEGTGTNAGTDSGTTDPDSVSSNTGTSNKGNSTVVYKNIEYGFNFSLPETWQKHGIVTEEWVGLGLGGANEGEVVERGSLLSIRHPEWTEQKPRQDIPILIFTLEQWNALQQEKFHIGAAPIGPKELGRNAKYVFALPARYNFAFPTGYEEVETILAGNPLQAF